jgi:hypothetical protein
MQAVFACELPFADRSHETPLSARCSDALPGWSGRRRVTQSSALRADLAAGVDIVVGIDVRRSVR